MILQRFLSPAPKGIVLATYTEEARKTPNVSRVQSWRARNGTAQFSPYTLRSVFFALTPTVSYCD